MVKVKRRYIKSENRKWLIGYLLLHIVIFALFSSLINFSLIDTDQLISKLKDPQGFIPLTTAILIIVMEGIFKNSVKEFFVFWSFKNRLPGHRAFSHIGPSDTRIDMERGRQMFPDGLPSDPKIQNSEWFRLYRQYQDELQVFYSHKAFLLTRDLTSLTILFIPLSISGHFLLGSKPLMLVYHLLILVMLSIVISLSAKHYAERFVANVLAEVSIRQS
ncbi:MAG: hypothetical protein JRI63_06830 [Deltaproteobacteria bacterium]|nr:hypothetical protein [Deltaproteobacteria bacterium]